MPTYPIQPTTADQVLAASYNQSSTNPGLNVTNDALEDAHDPVNHVIKTSATYTGTVGDVRVKNTAGTVFLMDNCYSANYSAIEVVNPTPLSKATIDLTASGVVVTPGSGKALSIFGCRFSCTSGITTVGFQWGAGGSLFEKWQVAANVNYGMDRYPLCYTGAANASLYCVVAGTGTVTVNVEYTQN